jgi:hypothetical protein
MAQQKPQWREVPVDSILLDTENYRTGKQSDQRAAIAAMIHDQSEKLVRLAEDISQNGLSPIQGAHRREGRQGSLCFT